MNFKQPPRGPADGGMHVAYINDDTLVIAVDHAGDAQSLILSEYNASRVVAALALLLGIRLNSQDAKAIKL